MGAAPIPISAPTCGFFLAVIPANIATSIPYRQYCFAYDSSAAQRRLLQGQPQSFLDIDASLVSPTGWEVARQALGKISKAGSPSAQLAPARVALAL